MRLRLPNIYHVLTNILRVLHETFWNFITTIYVYKLEEFFIRYTISLEISLSLNRYKPASTVRSHVYRFDVIPDVTGGGADLGQ